MSQMRSMTGHAADGFKQERNMPGISVLEYSTACSEAVQLHARTATFHSIVAAGDRNADRRRRVICIISFTSHVTRNLVPKIENLDPV